MITSCSFTATGRRRGRNGMALVLVLAFLVILSALLISFYSSVNNEFVAAKSSAASVETRQLAESVTSLVTSQIADATAGYQDAAARNGILSWASQPGMIRTYDDKGLPYKYYKLYSSDYMVISDATAASPGYNVNNEFGRDVPADWTSRPATFTDLNAPVRTQTNGSSTSGSSTTSYVWPIVDPTVQKSTATAKDGIDGFEILRPPGFAGSSTRPSATTDVASSPDLNPAPMPARWIYVLKDGTLTAAPESTAVSKLDWSSVTDPRLRPTKANPIVGRIAFWTDDDTAKINVNTASEGTFWARPWSTSADETKLADYIPAQNEFQRYPGHPAMTCLSPVFGSVLPITNEFDRSGKSNYYFLVPRVMDGGTYAATQAASGNTGVGFDNERLFASVDELAFAPQFSGRRLLFSRVPIANQPEYLNLVQRGDFFLTATSRAPEVNLFNKPRIGLWPLQYDMDAAGNKKPDPQIMRNPKDRLIAFCGTTGLGTSKEARYYFQRFNEYTVNGTIRGDGRTTFGSPIPSSQSPVMDMNLVPRNQQLYSYLQTLTSQNIPGFGGSFVSKYDANPKLPAGFSDRNQILTEMFDYVRTNVNAYNTAAGMNPQYDYAPARRGFPVAGETQLTPTVLSNSLGSTKGFGRFMTIPEVALVFIRQPDQKDGSGNTVQSIKAAVIMEQFNPSPGLASWSPHTRTMIYGLDSMAVSGKSLNLPAPKAGAYPWNFTTARVGYAGGGHCTAFMGLLCQFKYFQNNPDPPKIVGLGGTEREYPFVSTAPVILPAGATSLSFSGGELKIEIYSGYENKPNNTTPPAPDHLVQTLHVKFPPIAAMPVPQLTDMPDFNTRMAGGHDKLIRPGIQSAAQGDVVRSMEVPPDNEARGDLRILAALADVPAEMFEPHYFYNDPAQYYAHSLRSSGSGILYLTNAQKKSGVRLVSSASYSAEPAAARDVQMAVNMKNGLGDFDNATGDMEDGAYVNKADEGNLATSHGGYFDRGSFNVESGATYSPNRQISSAVSFGSLPSGVKATEAALRSGGKGRPWQTLLFTPQPASGEFRLGAAATANHPGFGVPKADTSNPSGKNQPPYIEPPDHLWLDLFTMPIVEPYAISEPFSTAGKVNLNFQLAPFTYIKRSTGLVGVMRSTKFMAIPTANSDKKSGKRYLLNTDVGAGVDGIRLEGGKKGTLYGFWQKFHDGDLFRSASQICDINLVPQDGSNDYTTMASFWAANQRTGDNVREEPYGHIYPRVTTKSNSFTIHMRVQALRKTAGSPPDQWDENRDQVVSEYRGSTSIERYIDAANPNLPDFADGRIQDSLDRYYRFRVVRTKAFNP